MEKVAYLGPEESYSYLAAKKFRPSAVHIAYPSFRKVFNALDVGECDAAALPIENSLNGSVIENLDLLQAAKDVFAAEETKLPLDHRLAFLQGADLKCIKRIYSHEQPLAQCADYLYKNFPDAKLIAAPSTAAGLDSVKTSEDAAIVGAHVRRDGIVLLSANIADYPNNFTEFLLVRKGSADASLKTDRIFFSVTCRHSSGALLDILEPMRSGGMNMTKIQSRPIKESNGEYRFFIEVEGDYSLSEIRSVLKSVQDNSLSFRLLGAYGLND